MLSLSCDMSFAARVSGVLQVILLGLLWPCLMMFEAIFEMLSRGRDMLASVSVIMLYVQSTMRCGGDAHSQLAQQRTRCISPSLRHLSVGMGRRKIR